MKQKFILSIVLCCFCGIGQLWATTYTRVNEVSEITNGDVFLVVIQDGATTSTGYAVNAESTNYASVTIAGSSITASTSTLEWTVTVSDGSFTFKNDTKYIYNGGSNTTLTANGTTSCTWVITKLSNGYFKVQKSNTSGRYLAWSGSKFAGYASGSLVNQIESSSALAQYSGAISFYKKNTTPPATPCTVTWKVAGNTYTTGGPTTNVTSGNKVTTLPVAPTEALSACSGTFVGWSTVNPGSEGESTTTSAPNDLFTDIAGSPTISTNTTFYAIFRKEQ